LALSRCRNGRGPVRLYVVPGPLGQFDCRRVRRAPFSRDPLLGLPPFAERMRTGTVVVFPSLYGQFDCRRVRSDRFRVPRYLAFTPFVGRFWAASVLRQRVDLDSLLRDAWLLHRRRIRLFDGSGRPVWTRPGDVFHGPCGPFDLPRIPDTRVRRVPERRFRVVRYLAFSPPLSNVLGPVRLVFSPGLTTFLDSEESTSRDPLSRDPATRSSAVLRSDSARFGWCFPRASRPFSTPKSRIHDPRSPVGR
jgi:hypothetical protein